MGRGEYHKVNVPAAAVGILMGTSGQDLTVIAPRMHIERTRQRDGTSATAPPGEV
jgi:hypothetical protein